jgi:hypothetical protein
MRSPRTIALACVAVVFLIGLYGLAKLATNPRADITAVPTPPPVILSTAVKLKPGQQLCQKDVALQTDSKAIRVYSASPTPDVPQLKVTLRGDGWSTSALSPEGGTPGGGGDGIYDTTFASPPRSLLATVCVATASPTQEAILAGSEEDRVRSRTPTLVDGKPIVPRVGMIVLAGGPRSPLSQAKTVLSRAASFAPAPIGWLSLGIVLVLVGLGVPTLTVYALLRALRNDPSMSRD